MKLRGLVVAFGTLPVVVAALILTGQASYLPIDLLEHLQITHFWGEQSLLIGAGLIVLYAGISTWFGSNSQNEGDSFQTRRQSAPEVVTAEEAAIVGSTFDDYLEMATEYEVATDERDLARQWVRERVRQTAVRVLRTDVSCSAEEAHRRLDEGDWTDDPRAAAFLGAPEAPDPSFLIRLRDWLHSRPVFEIRLEHTLDALEADIGGDGS